MQTISSWLEDTFIPLFLSRPWPTHPRLGGGTVRLVPQRVELSGGNLQTSAQLIHCDDSGEVCHITERWVYLGTLPEADLPAAGGLEDVLQRWLAAVEHGFTQHWRIAEYPETTSAADLFQFLPSIVDVVRSHIEQGPLVPRPATHRPQHTPLLLELAATGGDPLATFTASPDTITLRILGNCVVEVTLHAPEAQAVLCRQDGRLEAIEGPRGPLRAVLGWLAAAARAADDPTVRIIDPDDAYDDEGYLEVLSIMLGRLAGEQRVDWRAEHDALASAVALPDTPGSQAAWRAFLRRHFSTT